MLGLCAILPFALALAAQAYPGRQATRGDIALRDVAKRSGLLQPRTSQASCASGTRDALNNCCATSSTINTLQGTCCAEAVYRNEPCNSNACCEGGASQILTTPPTSDDLAQCKAGHYSPCIRQRCCPTGTKPVDNGLATGDCVRTTRKRDAHAVMLSKRSAPEDPLRQMTFRDDTWRTQLSPHLVADLFVDDWQMSYNGEKIIDWEARAAAGSLKVGKFIPKSWVWKGTTDYLAKAHARGEEYIPIPYSNDYEIRLDDVPELYLAILQHPKFQGSITINGIEYKPELMKEIFSHSHNWNSTIHGLP